MSRTIFFVSLVLVSSGVPVVGQDFVQPSASLALSDQSQGVAQPASFHEPLDGCSGNCVSTTSCRDWWTRPTPGPNVSFELMWFRPHATDPGTSISNRWSDGSRFTVGYLNECGQELRVRFFEWDTDAGTAGNDDTDLLCFDTEYAGRFDLGRNWDGELSLGVRYAEFRKQDSGPEPDVDFEKSLGPVLGLLLKSRPIIGQARLVGSARYAHQFGKAADGTTFEVASFSVTELQIGMELSRETRLGRIDFRPFFEAQKWSGDYDGSDEDLGLIGMGMLLQVSR